MKNKNKHYSILLFLILNIAGYQNAFAHGSGGGQRSYELENNDYDATHEAKKKAVIKQRDHESWNDFINAVKQQKKENQNDSN